MSTTEITPAAAAALLGLQVEQLVRSYVHLPASRRDGVVSLLGTLCETAPGDAEAVLLESLSTAGFLVDQSSSLLSEVPANCEAARLDVLFAPPSSADVEEADVVNPGILVEVFGDGKEYSLEAVVPIRVVPAPLEDEVVLEKAYREVQDHLKDSLHDAGSAPVELHGFLRYVLGSSTAPLARRMAATVEALETFKRQHGRLELQEILSSLGLGRINGLDMEALEALADEVLARIFVALKRAYPRSVTAGGLYYLAEKGTSKEAFNTWFLGLCAVRNWDPERLDFAVDLAVKSGGPLDAATLSYVSRNSVLALFDSFGKLEGDPARVLALSAYHRDSLADVLATQPARPLDVVAADGAASQLECAAALVRAFRSGVPASDPSVVAVFSRLDQAPKIMLVRCSELLEWGYAVLAASRS